MRILLIEDEPTTAKAIELMLTTEGFNVYQTDLGEEGLDLGKLYDYDIILLDLNLPDMHGYDVLKKLRVAKVQTPVLILSGISEMDSKVRSFGFGADDYVTKPFHKDELVARIHAVVRRSKGHSQSVIKTGKLSVNLDTKTVEVDGARVHLTGKEYAMLELLSLRKGTTLTKEMFLNHLYNGMDEPELKIIDVFICKLRKKLATACGGDNYIETVWGRGYVLRDPGAEAQAACSRRSTSPPPFVVDSPPKRAGAPPPALFSSPQSSVARSEKRDGADEPCRCDGWPKGVKIQRSEGQPAQCPAACQRQPEQEERKPVSARRTGDGVGQPRAQLDERAGDVGKAEADLALVLQHEIDAAHGEGEERDRDKPFDRLRCQRRHCQHGRAKDEGEADPAAAGHSAAKQGGHCDTRDEAGDQAGGDQCGSAVARDADAEARRIPAHERDEELTRSEEADRIHIARDRRNRESEQSGRAGVHEHGNRASAGTRERQVALLTHGHIPAIGASLLGR